MASWSLQQRSALSPRQFGACFAVLAFVSGLVGTFFWVMGARFVTGFAGIEVVLVGVAFAWHAVHASDGEHVHLQDRTLHVEGRRGLRSWRDQVPVVGLHLAATADGAIDLRSGHRRWVLGGHATVAQRRRVLADMRRALSQTTT
jgi:uncharacterized membrane protein